MQFWYVCACIFGMCVQAYLLMKFALFRMTAFIETILILMNQKKIKNKKNK